MYPPVKMKLGELLVSLTYLPAKNTLTIGVLKARNLKAKDINGKSGKLLSVSRPLAVKIASKEIRPSKINSRSVAGPMGRMTRQPSV